MKPQILIVTDEVSGTALIRGADAEVATRLCCPDRKYSRYPKGWVVPMSDVGDVLAFGQYHRLLTVCHPLKRGAA